ncbi:MAG: hypothetical protein HFJ28_07505 [Clostridia bacterium]|nr:hypothetical protein [Clostridia bacterium]
MTRQEAEHALNMLIELQLIKAIKATREGKFKEEKKMIEETIQIFEQNLPDWSNQIPDCHAFIIRKLAQIQEKEQEER